MSEGTCRRRERSQGWPARISWRAIGSSSFDDRSFETNDELTLSIKDETLARRPDGIFEKYVARTTEIQLDRWRKRPWSHKLTDHSFYTLNEPL
jgi:cardiolipin synthase A/B